MHGGGTLFKKVTNTLANFQKGASGTDPVVHDAIIAQELAVQELLKQQLCAVQRLLAQNSHSLAQVVSQRLSTVSELEAKVAELSGENERLSNGVNQDVTGGTRADESSLRVVASRTNKVATPVQMYADAPETPPALPQYPGHLYAEPFSQSVNVPRAEVKDVSPERKPDAPSETIMSPPPSGKAPRMLPLRMSLAGVSNNCERSRTKDTDDSERIEAEWAEYDNEESRRDARRSLTAKIKAQPMAARESITAYSPNKMLFADANMMKQRLQEALSKPKYDVCDFYKLDGVCQKIARSTCFENATLAIIALNAIWISYDTDYNHADVLADADPIFLCAENIFCFYFTIEIAVRFGAFQNKINCFRDGWFTFDSFLVFLMVFETWIVTGIIMVLSGTVPLPPTNILTNMKLLKLARVARMARLLRAAPELMIMITAIFAAFRSVVFAFGMLLALVYVFAILFTQIMKGTKSGEENFSHIFQSVVTLLLQGAFPDNTDMIMSVSGLDDENATSGSLLYAIIFVFYLVLASLTVLNMLVGILCDVVSEVSTFEKEEMLLNFVREELVGVLEDIGVRPDEGGISKDLFEDLLTKEIAIRVLHQVGVDVVGLVDQTDFIFEGGRELKFADFFDLILKLRGTNNATVRDMVDLRKLICKEMDHMNDKVHVAMGGGTSTTPRMHSPRHSPRMHSPAHSPRVKLKSPAPRRLSG
jgi:hypothetical protein